MSGVIGRLGRYYPVVAFLAGFLWDALTLGQRVRPMDFWRLGGQLAVAACLVVLITAWSRQEGRIPALAAWLVRCPSRGRMLLSSLPYLVLQFCFGGLFSALFILYFKSAGHLGSWIMAAGLAVLLVANEFSREVYARRLIWTWSMLGLNAILLAHFALPYAIGTLDPAWFPLSSLTGASLIALLWRVVAGPGRRFLAPWLLAGLLTLAWLSDMIPPVPLVRKALALGYEFSQQGGEYRLRVEPASFWQPWREQSPELAVAEGGRLYAVSAIHAPRGVTALLEHRWERRTASGWQMVARSRFEATGGRERGFRGYSWVVSPPPGEWRLVVATADGKTIASSEFRVIQGTVSADRLEERRY